MQKSNPFGDEASRVPHPANPFGDDESRVEQTPAEAARQIEHAARKIRGLRSRMGSEGLTLQAARELIDDVASGLEAAARALRSLE